MEEVFRRQNRGQNIHFHKFSFFFKKKRKKERKKKLKSKFKRKALSRYSNRLISCGQFKAVPSVMVICILPSQPLVNLFTKELWASRTDDILHLGPRFMNTMTKSGHLLKPLLKQLLARFGRQLGLKYVEQCLEIIKRFDIVLCCSWPSI